MIQTRNRSNSHQLSENIEMHMRLLGGIQTVTVDTNGSALQIKERATPTGMVGSTDMFNRRW